MKFPKISEKLISDCSTILGVDESEVHKSMWKEGRKLKGYYKPIYPPNDMTTESIEVYYNEILNFIVEKKIFDMKINLIEKSVSDELIYDSGIVVQTRTTKKYVLLRKHYVHDYIRSVLKSIPEIYKDVNLFVINDTYNKKNSYTIVNFHNIADHEICVEEVDNYDGTITYYFDFHVMPFIEY